VKQSHAPQQSWCTILSPEDTADMNSVASANTFACCGVNERMPNGTIPRESKNLRSLLRRASMSALHCLPNDFLQIERVGFLIGLISVLPYWPRVISKYFPLCKNRTRVGCISTTLTPSMMDPSVAIRLFIIARRSPGSSCQIIPDNFSEG